MDNDLGEMHFHVHSRCWWNSFLGCSKTGVPSFLLIVVEAPGPGGPEIPPHRASSSGCFLQPAVKEGSLACGRPGSVFDELM